MTEYTALVTVRRTDDTVHTKIELNQHQHAQLEVDMLIALEFLRAVLDRAEGAGALVIPFKETVRSTIGKIVDADIDGRRRLLQEFVERNDVLGDEEEQDETL